MSIELRVVFAGGAHIVWERNGEKKERYFFLDGNVGRFAGTWIVSPGILLAVINTGGYFSSKFGVFYYDMFII